MATVDLSHIQFWQPPLNPASSKQHTALPQIRKNGVSGLTASCRTPLVLPQYRADEIRRCSAPFKPAIAASQHPGRDSAFQHEDDAAGARGRHTDPADHEGKASDAADGDFLSIDDLLAFSSKGNSKGLENSEDAPQHLETRVPYTSGSLLDPNQSRSDNSISSSQGTREKPVTLEDDEPEAAAVSVSVDVGADHPSELSTGPWWDVENECYIGNDGRPILPLEEEGLPLISMPAQGQPYPHHHPSQDRVNGQNNGDSGDGTIGGASGELAPHTPPQQSNENDGGWSDDKASELQQDILLALDEQEKLSSSPTPISPHPQCHSVELSHLQRFPENDESGTGNATSEELGHGSPPRPQGQGEEAQAQQQQDEVPAENGRSSNGKPGPEERVEKRSYRDMDEQTSSNVSSEDSDSNRGTNIEEDEDDEDPRPAKRQRLRSAAAHEALDPPTDLILDAPSRQPRRITPPSATQLEVDNTQSQTDRRSPAAPVDDTQCRILRTLQDPSAPAESILTAEYHEWACQSVLKRTRIGDKTTYNLEFQLRNIPEHLHLPVLSEALRMRSDKETTAKAATPRDARARSRVRPAALQARRKRAPWTPEDNALLRRMKEEDNCSWEEIHAELSHHTPGSIQVHYCTKLKK